MCSSLLKFCFHKIVSKRTFNVDVFGFQILKCIFVELKAIECIIKSHADGMQHYLQLICVRFHFQFNSRDRMDG